MPNILYKYILNIYIWLVIMLITFLNESEHIFCTQLNDLQYIYLIQIILFTINHLFAHGYMVSSIAM